MVPGGTAAVRSVSQPEHKHEHKHALDVSAHGCAALSISVSGVECKQT